MAASKLLRAMVSVNVTIVKDMGCYLKTASRFLLQESRLQALPCADFEAEATFLQTSEPPLSYFTALISLLEWLLCCGEDGWRR